MTILPILHPLYTQTSLTNRLGICYDIWFTTLAAHYTQRDELIHLTCVTILHYTYIDK